MTAVAFAVAVFCCTGGTQKLATTWIRPIHANRGKSIAQTLADRTNYVRDKTKTTLDYATNPDKTDGGEYVTAYACTPEMSDLEFLLSKKEHLAITGRTQYNDIANL